MDEPEVAIFKLALYKADFCQISVWKCAVNEMAIFIIPFLNRLLTIKDLVSKIGISHEVAGRKSAKTHRKFREFISG